MDLTTVPDPALFEEGVNRFDDGRFWDAHESWEDLWNEMKRSGCHRMEILAIQGLIQTGIALLLHHERRNLRGVLNQWKKLQPKLEAWQVIMKASMSPLTCAPSKPSLEMQRMRHGHSQHPITDCRGLMRYDHLRTRDIRLGVNGPTEEDWVEFAATDLGKRNRSDANRKTLLLGAGLIIIWVVPAGAFGGFVTALVMLIAVGSMLAMLHFTKLRSRVDLPSCVAPGHPFHPDGSGPGV